METPYTREKLRQLNARAKAPQIMSTISMPRLLRSAMDLDLQAQDFANRAGQEEQAYVFYNRLANFIIKVVMQNKQYKFAQFEKERQRFKALANNALGKAEVLRGKLMQRFNAVQPEALQGSSEQKIAVPMPNVAPSAPPMESAPAPQPLGAPKPEKKRSWDNLKIPGFSNDAQPAGGVSKPLADSKDVPSRHAFVNTSGLRTIHLPQGLMVEFLKYAERNTVKDVETCAMLTGVAKNDGLHITTVIIPDQDGTANTTVTKGEEALFDLQDKEGLLTFGWIHTHPTQTCFLSSVDLHSQFSYQVMVPEAIAIVMAPSKVPNSGIFILTEKGLDILGACDHTGFHKHTENDGLYGQAQHVKLLPGNARFFDLRKS